MLNGLEAPDTSTNSFICMEGTQSSACWKKGVRTWIQFRDQLVAEWSDYPPVKLGALLLQFIALCNALHFIMHQQHIPNLKDVRQLAKISQVKAIVVTRTILRIHHEDARALVSLVNAHSYNALNERTSLYCEREKKTEGVARGGGKEWYFTVFWWTKNDKFFAVSRRRVLARGVAEEPGWRT
ncbi:hypothetical protein K1719_031411 [Acacia pycnantha]|nr:hypothetical protein K1719_031411 [Acacia pycnantha]